MSAITAALSQIDGVAGEGDLVPDPAAPLELETAGEPILLPDGKRIYPPCLHGQPIDELAWTASRTCTGSPGWCGRDQSGPIVDHPASVLVSVRDPGSTA